MKRLGWLRLALGMALLLLLFWTLREAPLADILAILGRLAPGSVLALILLNTAILLLLNLRGWLILQALGRPVPFSSLLLYRLAGFGVTYFTPGPQMGGEPLQVYLLQKRQGLPASTALAGVALDKLFELLANFTFLAVGLVLILSEGLLAGLIRVPALLVAAGLLGLPLAYLTSLWAGRFPLTALVARLPARLTTSPRSARLVPLVASTERQISALCRKKPLTIGWVLLLSGLVWVVMIAEYWLTLAFLGPPLDLFETVVALTAARLAFLLPVPAGLGVLEASQVLALETLGLDPAVGVAAALLIRARDLSFGGLGLWLMGALTGRRPAINPVRTNPVLSTSELQPKTDALFVRRKSDESN